MRPYLAIIKDSFRAAFASRVLYVLLGIITLFLLLLAPFHCVEMLDWKIDRRQHVRRPNRMVMRLVNEREDHPELQRIWERLPEELHEKLEGVEEVDESLNAINFDGPPENRRRRTDGYEEVYRELIDQLNVIIEEPDFYRAEDWESLTLAEEAESLIDSGVESLNDERKRRLNRLLIANAFGSSLQNGAATSLEFYYLGWKWDFLSTNTTHGQFASMLTSSIPWFFDKFVMSIGLLIAILVTANIIPETFDPGSLNLLLSKPVSRWALLLSKFIGGCAFVALCATYLMFGTWIWMGIAMDVWDRAFLYSIPLYILVFAVYYSVSTLVGIWYRSAILSVVLTAIFWGVCFLVGWGYGRVDTKMENSEISRLAPVGDDVLQVDPLSRILAWKDSDETWATRLKPSFDGDDEIGFGIASFIAPLPFPKGVGPVLDGPSQRVLCSLLSIRDPSSSSDDLYAADVDDLSKFLKVGKLPGSTLAAFPTEKGTVVVTSRGEFFGIDREEFDLTWEEAVEESDQVLSDETNETSEETATEGSVDDDESATSTNDESDTAAKTTEPDLENADTDGSENENADANDMGDDGDVEVETKPVREVFRSLGPDSRVSVRRAHSVDVNRVTGDVAIYRQGEVTLFRRGDDSQYTKFASLEIDLTVESTMTVHLAFQGQTIVLVYGNGQVITIDAEKMQEQKSYLPEARSGIEQIVGSPNGRWFALIYRNENLWLLDTQDDSLSMAPINGQGSVSSIAFDSNNRLWVGDRTDRASRYNLESMEVEELYAAKGDWLKNVFRYGLRPVYKIFPKPSETYRLVTHLSEFNDARKNQSVDLTRGMESRNPWSPVWSGLGFMAFVLLIACVSFSRKDY